MKVFGTLSLLRRRRKGWCEDQRVAFEVALWRAIAVYRVAALGYAVLLATLLLPRYAHPVAALTVLTVMAVWTVIAGYAYARPVRRDRPLLAIDLAVATGCLLATRWVVQPGGVAAGQTTLPTVWVAGAVLAFALSGGRRRGVAAALVLGTADVAVRSGLEPGDFAEALLLLLTGLVAGHLSRLALDAEARLHQATEREAATRERERLARDMHDSVLQVLALVQRRGVELGGEAAELGRLAGEQETALRALVATTTFEPTRDGLTDLRAVLSRYASTTVHVATPADPVPAAPHVAERVAAAVGAAIDNVARHCPAGTRAFVLLEDEGPHLVVTVRDDGPGIPDGRLARAEAEGRLGVAQSIRGRIHDLGGTVEVRTGPDLGTEVEMRVRRGLRPTGPEVPAGT
jgi:signal transduction histidine kinase